MGVIQYVFFITLYPVYSKYLEIGYKTAYHLISCILYSVSCSFISSIVDSVSYILLVVSCIKNIS